MVKIYETVYRCSICAENKVEKEKIGDSYYKKCIGCDKRSLILAEEVFKPVN
ncbi:hypothetical protein VP501E541_P0067 [Vibrio phage 501E54-1]|nr:hypothetical protein VP501E541_P0067 [Vibrio phage 501E54-1]